MTGAAPLTAIVTPVYNGARYLAETMEAVQAQTYRNLVHVVLDNSSTDETPQIIARYANGRVPVLTARTSALLALYPNWNHALSLMPGETAYFRILCADDLITPDAIARTVALMESGPDVVMALAAERRGDSVWDKGWGADGIFDGREKVGAYLRDELALPVVHCLYRRAAYDARAPEFFDLALENADMDTALAIMKTGKVGFVNAPLFITREHEGSMTSQTMRRTRMHYPDWLTYLHRHGPDAMGAEPAERLARRFKRYYFRRMLRWRLFGDGALAARHAAQLDLIGAAPRAVDYLDAALDWPLVKLALRPAWRRYPY